MFVHSFSTFEDGPKQCPQYVNVIGLVIRVGMFENRAHIQNSKNIWEDLRNFIAIGNLAYNANTFS